MAIAPPYRVYMVFANPYGHGEHSLMDHRGRGAGVVHHLDNFSLARFVGGHLDADLVERKLKTSAAHFATAQSAKIRENPDAWHSLAVHRYHSQCGEVAGGDAEDNPKPERLVVPNALFDADYRRKFAEGMLIAADAATEIATGTQTLDAKGAPMPFSMVRQIAKLRDARRKAHAAWTAVHGAEPEGAHGPAATCPCTGCKEPRDAAGQAMQSATPAPETTLHADATPPAHTE